MSKPEFSVIINSESVTSLPVLLADLDYFFNKTLGNSVNTFIVCNNSSEISETIDKFGKSLGKIKVVKNEENEGIGGIKNAFLVFSNEVDLPIVEKFISKLKKKDTPNLAIHKKNQYNFITFINKWFLKILRLDINPRSLKSGANLLYINNFSSENFELENYQILFLKSLDEGEKWSFIEKEKEISSYKDYLSLWKDLIRLKFNL